MHGRIRGRLTGSILLGALLAAVVVTPGTAVARGSVVPAAASRHQVADLAAAPFDVVQDGKGISVAGQSTNVVPDSAVVRRPDGRIRLAVGTASGNPDPYVGNNVYNTTGAHQTSRADFYSTTTQPFTYTFGILIQNDGTTADRFKVKATGAAVNGWKVRYFHGATDITSAVIAGTYRTTSLAPSATYLIKAKVTQSLAAASPGPKRLVTITSSANGTKKDAVKFVMKLATCGC